MDIKELLNRLCGVAIREGLECPEITKVYIYNPPARARGSWVYIYDEVYVEPLSESIAVGKGPVNILVFRLTAGYMALAIHKTTGALDAEKAVELARKHYFSLLIG